MRNVSITSAKNNLPALVHAVEAGETVKLTRHGVVRAVLLPLEQYSALNNRGEGFVRELTRLRQRQNSALLDDDDSFFDNQRGKEEGRDFSWS